MTMNTATISGATQASPVVITATAHGFSDGDDIGIISVVGMTEINRKHYSMTLVDANSFSIPVDGTGFTAYSSAGEAKTASYCFNEDVQDLHRLNATGSKIKIGTAATDHIAAADLDIIRGWIYEEVYGRLTQVFAAADIKPSNLKNSNIIRHSEARIVHAEYLQIKFQGNDATMALAESLNESGWAKIQDVIDGNIIIYDSDGSAITPDNSAVTVAAINTGVIPIASIVDGDDANITSMTGRSPEDDANRLDT